MPEVKFSDLRVNQPISVNHPDTELTITVDPNNPMPRRTLIFELQVVDDSGNPSPIRRHGITVIDTDAPIAIITGPEEVSSRESFTLSGKRSRDVGGGTIAKYI